MLSYPLGGGGVPFHVFLELTVTTVLLPVNWIYGCLTAVPIQKLASTGTWPKGLFSVADLPGSAPDFLLEIELLDLAG